MRCAWYLRDARLIGKKMEYIENKTFDEIEIGDTAELTRELKVQDIELFTDLIKNKGRFIGFNSNPVQGRSY